MKSRFAAALVGLSLFVPVSAAAQTPAPSSQSSSPTVNLWYVGANTGVAVVAKAGGIFGGEGGVRVWKNLDVVGEIVWMQNIVNSDTQSSANTIAGYLATTQGKPATADVNVSAFYSGAGVRWVFEGTHFSRFTPYVIGTFGSTHTDTKSTFTLDGADISGSLPQYGVTLGSDLAGTKNCFTFDGGFGVLTTFDAWYVDLGARLVSVDTSGSHTNVGRFLVGGGYRF